MYTTEDELRENQTAIHVINIAYNNWRQKIHGENK